MGRSSGQSQGFWADGEGGSVVPRGLKSFLRFPSPMSQAHQEVQWPVIGSIEYFDCSFHSHNCSGKADATSRANPIRDFHHERDDYLRSTTQRETCCRVRFQPISRSSIAGAGKSGRSTGLAIFGEFTPYPHREEEP